MSTPLEPIAYYTTGPPEPFRNWRTGCIAFGIVAIVGGVLSVGTGLLALLPLVLAHTLSTSTPRSGPLVSGFLVYLTTGAGLIWLGVGAVRLRRWVRPLVLTAGTITIVFGFFVLLGTVLAVPIMRESMAAGSGTSAPVRPTARTGATPGPRPATLPPGMFEIIIIGTLAFLALLFIVVPGAFVWFYRKPTVKQMLEYFDPVPRWTDGCPVPVLGLAVGWAMIAVGALIAIPQGVTPIFGTVLFGPAAAGVQLAEAGAAGVVAWLAYRRRRAGWWGSLGLGVLWAVAALVNLLSPDRIELYRDAGYTTSELDAIRRTGAAGGGVIGAIWAAGFLVALGYLLYVRRYFFAPAPAVAEAGEPAQGVPAEEPPGQVGPSSPG